MKCGKCGSELEADSRFCTGCGAPVAAASPAPAATPTPITPAAPSPAATTPAAAAKPAGGKKGCACAFTGIGCIVLVVAGLVLIAGAILFFRADLENLANQLLADQAISQSAPAPAVSSSPSAPSASAPPPTRAGNLELYAGNWSVVNPNEGSNPNENVLILWTEGSGLRGRDGGNNTTWSLQPAGDGGFAGAMTDADGAQVPVRISLQADLNYLTVVFAPPDSEYVSVIFERIQ